VRRVTSPTIKGIIMTQRVFKLALVDDERDDVSDLITLLHSIPEISVRHFFGYDQFGADPGSVVAAATEFDFFVLDVYMQENESSQFLRFTGSIRGVRPFVAYTRLRKGDDISIGAHKYEELHKLVLERGGMGLVTKVAFNSRGPDHPARRDQEYEVAERVISFYWQWKLCGGVQ
jgi:hypothetical protein